MYGYVPLGLILSGIDPYGPTGELAGKKPYRLFSLDRLRRFRLHRPAQKAGPVQCCGKA